MSDKHSTKKRATVRPIIFTPMVFVLIALIVLVPLFVKGFGILQDKVHAAQKTLPLTYSDLAVDDAYFNECVKEGTAQTKDALQLCEKVGTLTCDNAAVGCDIYYGINRVSKRSGAALSTKSALFGNGGKILIDGDASTCFKALYHVEKGDVFTVNAADGEYQYTVTEILTAEEYTGKPSDEFLVITTDASRDAFAHQKKARYTVVATLGTEVDA